MVLCLDEKTSVQPRPRQAATLPPRPQSSMKVEHEYERLGALNLFAAFDTRTGQVWGQTYERKRQVELIAFLEYLDNEIPAHITQIHVVLDNLRMHKGKKVQAWLAQHPRFVFHFPPVHCSWMNQVEQWFSILQRKRLNIANFKNKQALQSVCKHSLLSGTLMLIPLTGQLNLLPKSWLNVNPNPLLPRQLDFRTLSTVTCTKQTVFSQWFERTGGFSGEGNLLTNGKC
jgi:transposase